MSLPAYPAVPLSLRTAVAAVVAGALLAAGCSKKDEAQTSANPTQVVAKVNSQEITVHQVNAALSRAQGIPADAAERAKREILERLVDQNLAMQQALLRKLDRTPSVQQSLEAAKAEILSRAYLEQVAATIPKPTPEEAKRYYDENPELFAQRRVYLIEEVAFEAPAAVRAEIRARSQKARSMKEIVDLLQARKVAFAPNRGVRAAEQLPMEVVPTFAKASEGEVLYSESGDRAQVVRIASVRREPVDEATAMPRIAQFLLNRRTTEAIQADIKKLRAGAKIEYVGEFAQAGEAVDKARAEAAAKAKADAEAKAKAAAEAEARSSEATKARQAAETKARLEAEERERAAAMKSAPLPQDSVKKAVGAFK